MAGPTALSSGPGCRINTAFPFAPLRLWSLLRASRAPANHARRAGVDLWHPSFSFSCSSSRGRGSEGGPAADGFLLPPLHGPLLSAPARPAEGHLPAAPDPPTDRPTDRTPARGVVVVVGGGGAAPSLRPRVRRRGPRPRPRGRARRVVRPPGAGCRALHGVPSPGCAGRPAPRPASVPPDAGRSGSERAEHPTRTYSARRCGTWLPSAGSTRSFFVSPGGS